MNKNQDHLSFIADNQKAVKALNKKITVAEATIANDNANNKRVWAFVDKYIGSLLALYALYEERCRINHLAMQEIEECIAVAGTGEEGN